MNVGSWEKILRARIIYGQLFLTLPLVGSLFPSPSKSQSQSNFSPPVSPADRTEHHAQIVLAQIVLVRLASLVSPPPQPPRAVSSLCRCAIASLFSPPIGPSIRTSIQHVPGRGLGRGLGRGRPCRTTSTTPHRAPLHPARPPPAGSATSTPPSSTGTGRRPRSSWPSTASPGTLPAAVPSPRPRG